jgi:DNA-directed RNA polymerase specialized sigma24 family protein
VFDLLRAVNEDRRDPRTLSAHERRCLLVVTFGKETSRELGARFGVTASTIRSDWRRIRLALRK